MKNHEKPSFIDDFLIKPTFIGSFQASHLWLTEEKLVLNPKGWGQETCLRARKLRATSSFVRRYLSWTCTSAVIVVWGSPQPILLACHFKKFISTLDQTLSRSSSVIQRWKHIIIFTALSHPEPMEPTAPDFQVEALSRLYHAWGEQHPWSFGICRAHGRDTHATMADCGDGKILVPGYQQNVLRLGGTIGSSPHISWSNQGFQLSKAWVGEIFHGNPHFLEEIPRTSQFPLSPGSGTSPTTAMRSPASVVASPFATHCRRSALSACGGPCAVCWWSRPITVPRSTGKISGWCKGGKLAGGKDHGDDF